MTFIVTDVDRISVLGEFESVADAEKFVREGNENIDIPDFPGSADIWSLTREVRDGR